MKILYTVNRLGFAGGAEAYLRDLTDELTRRGHRTAIFSIGADESNWDYDFESVCRTSDIENLPFVPDIIHGQHNLQTIAAIGALPGVPALYHCHGAVWKEFVPRHPRILHYLAMSPTLAERMFIEYAIPPSSITILLNGIDLARFPEPGMRPQKPRRALFYHSRIPSESDSIEAIRKACARQRLELEFIGTHFNRMIESPESVLPNYDIVFASGMSAIDAIASGCAVIAIGLRSCGAMITPENFDRFRDANFSVAANVPPRPGEEIEEEILRYSSEKSAEVTLRLRREGDFRLIADRLEGIYAEVIARHAKSEPDLNAELIAASEHLQKIAPLAVMADSFFHGDWDSELQASDAGQLRAQLAAVERELGRIAD